MQLLPKRNERAYNKIYNDYPHIYNLCALCCIFLCILCVPVVFCIAKHTKYFIKYTRLKAGGDKRIVKLSCTHYAAYRTERKREFR